jgi:hypothetical protein
MNRATKAKDPPKTKKKPVKKKPGTDPAPASPRQMIGDFSHNGIRLSEVPKAALLAILDLTAEQVQKVSAQIRAALGPVGLFELTKEQRLARAPAVKQEMLVVLRDVANAMARNPQAVTKLDITPAMLTEPSQQYQELGGFNKFLTDAGDRLGDAQAVLELFQFKARRVVAAAIFADLTSPFLPQTQKDQLLIDASEVLDAEERELTAALEVRQNNAAALGRARRAADEQEKAVLILQTMRNIREGKPVPEALQQELALYYADLKA